MDKTLEIISISNYVCDKASSSLCTNLSIGLKEELENIIKDSDLDVEDFK